MNPDSIKAPANVWNALIVVFVLLAIFLAVLAVSGIKQFKYIGGGVPISNTISVTGDGESMSVPDIATFSFEVMEKGAEPAAAQKLATDKINKAIDYLKAQGIDEKDIKTTGYMINPEYTWKQATPCNQFGCPPSEQELIGYQVSQNIQVKVRATDKAGTLLAGIGEIGVSNISGISFTIDDEDSVKTAARADAIEHAKAKAEELADQLGVDLVRVVSFYEDQPYYPYMDARAYGGVMMEKDMAMSQANVAPSLPMGENKVTSRVTVTYEIR